MAPVFLLQNAFCRAKRLMPITAQPQAAVAIALTRLEADAETAETAPLAMKRRIFRAISGIVRGNEQT